MGSRNLRSQQRITAAVLAAIYGARAFADAPVDANEANENVLQEVIGHRHTTRGFRARPAH